MQVSKMIKNLITMFITNPNLASMQKHLSYINVDKIKAFLTKLPYSKVT